MLILKTSGDVFQFSSLGIARSLGRLGVPVYLYSAREDQFTPISKSKYLAGAYIVRDTGSDFLTHLLEIGSGFNRKPLLLPVDDFGAVFAATHYAELRRLFLMPEANAELVATVTDKAKLAELCRQHRHPHPETIAVNDGRDRDAVIDRTDYPFVIKRPQQWVGKGPTTRLIQDVTQMVEVLNAARYEGFGFVLQDYIPYSKGQNWVVQGYAGPDEQNVVLFTGLKIRSNPPETGAGCFVEAVENPALRKQAEGFLRDIGYKGILDLDYRLDPRDGTYKLLDFNPRLGAPFRLFQDEHGTDLVRALHLDLTGRRPARPMRPLNRRFIVEDYDARASLRYFRARRLGVPEWLRSLRNIDEAAWFSSDDPLPAFMVVARRFVGKSRRIEPRTPLSYRPGRFSGGRLRATHQ
ncbi:hypothetical protein [Falsiroseomonas sp. HW251]|uniref:carboxylate--amine ligase n=1 Tax=Falsiroseomonas sp. HW251 TaxID=3390998 RepID=UPI003D319BB2